MLICPNCGFKRSEENTECLLCGIIDYEYQKPQAPPPEAIETPVPADSSEIKENKVGPLAGFLADFLFCVKPKINGFYFAGRLLLFIGIAIWSVKFISSPIENNYAMRSFLHTPDLIFHEAGHVIFRPFGRFMMMLGGSLLQLLIPLICMGTFLIKTKDTFAASITLWWFGENLLDLAPYINDARACRLPLLGGPGTIHDWHFLLRKLKWLRHDHSLAITANTIGILLLLCALAWGGFMLYKQFRSLMQARHKDDISVQDMLDG